MGLENLSRVKPSRFTLRYGNIDLNLRASHAYCVNWCNLFRCKASWKLEIERIYSNVYFA